VLFCGVDDPRLDPLCAMRGLVACLPQGKLVRNALHSIVQLSRRPHQIRTQNRIQEIVPTLRFLLLFRGIFSLSRPKKHIFDRRSRLLRGFALSVDGLFLLSLKLWISVKIMGIR